TPFDGGLSVPHHNSKSPVNCRITSLRYRRLTAHLGTNTYGNSALSDSHGTVANRNGAIANRNGITALGYRASRGCTNIGREPESSTILNIAFIGNDWLGRACCAVFHQQQHHARASSRAAQQRICASHRS